MSDTYTKLFRSITASTIVSEPLATRWVWVTMLAQADRKGCVYAAIPGLARIANVSIQECEAALACFMSPDPYSRTPDNDGRRVVEVDGGWQLLNYVKYDAMRNEAERREAKREWDRQNRPSGHQRAKQPAPERTDETRQSDDSPTQSDETRQSDPMSHVSCLMEKLPPSAERDAPVADSPPPDPIWGTGLAWLERKGVPNPQARTILGKVRQCCGDAETALLLAQAEADDVSDPGRWLLACAAKRTQSGGGARAGPAPPSSRTRTALETLQGLKSDANRLDQRRNPQRPEQAALPEP